MGNNKAIVTMAIGDIYGSLWHGLCKSGWERYAQKHGFDIICIDSPIDDSERAANRSPAWQKCLILSQDFSKKYDRIVWIDSDILINADNAPSIVEEVPENMVGAIDVWSSPTSGWFPVALQRLIDITPKGDTFSQNVSMYYKKYGLPDTFDKVVQTGVLVLSPKHRDILEKTYYEYEEKGGSEWNYEMRPLSYELQKASKVHWIDIRYNMSWPIYKCLLYPFLMLESTLEEERKKALSTVCVNTAYHNGYFLHFPGDKSDMMLVNQDSLTWTDCKI
ncbi:hypothetical protein [Candidatus Magnetomonas plexicatena]|uniref:hypothetical protein n=1 Tax=Candidatus Magnetomonas plexicatena TaxID=2552947 RepID=UPI001C74FC7B|nr:hypothetical protein E2O03_000610 [Nitrospirales bacterium LBB_01]